MKVSKLLGEKVKYNYEIEKISINSLDVCKNDLFVLVNASEEYFLEAIDKKCKSIVLDDLSLYNKYKHLKINLIYVIDAKKALADICKIFYDDISKKMKIIGVTGTNGKTTITTLCYKYYRYLGKNVCLIGTNGIYINDTYYKNVNTTPNIITIYNTLTNAYKEKVRVVFIEVSSHGVKEGRVLGISFYLLLLSNVTLDHLDYHKSVIDYYYTKILFLTYSDYVIVNKDIKQIKEIVRIINKNVDTFSFDSVSNLYLSFEKTMFDINIDNINYHIVTNLIGEYNVYNILAFIKIITNTIFFNDNIISFLNKPIIINGRGEVFNTSKGTFVIDFAHSIDAVESILKLACNNKKRKIITLIGCGGNRDNSKRKAIGKIVTEMSDICIFTEDNSRNENTMDIINQMLTDANSICDIFVIENRKEAIKKCYELSQYDDICLILGKGCENYIEKSSKLIPFNDILEIKSLIGGI